MQEDQPSHSRSGDAHKKQRSHRKKQAQTAETVEGPSTYITAAVPTEWAPSRLPQPPGRFGRHSRNALRASLAVVGGRTAGALSRRLHLGGGTSIAGVVAQRLYPDIIEHLSTQLQQGSVLVTGTNGKTTTSVLTAAILTDAWLL